jgi:isocitrate dehydrogenase kinase/phosphatase
MHAGQDAKILILQRLVAQCTNNWRVVGITSKALDAFAASDFKPISRSGIQRAHIVDRHQTFRQIIEREFVQNEFWAHISENDKTILSVKGEYNNLASINWISLPDQGLFPNTSNHIYFAARKVGFRCMRADRDLLRKLYQQHR